MMTSAASYRRRRVGFFGGAAVVLALLAYGPLTLFAPLQSSSATATEFVAPTIEASDLLWPDASAVGIGALGFDGVLAQQGSATPVSIASITKLITVMTVLEEHPLTVGDPGPSITFTAKDVQYYFDMRALGGSAERVRSGLSLSEYEVVETVLIASANNYARSLGVWAFGSDDAFVAAAADWLTRHGLSSTTLVEASGIDPRNTSTVPDLIELGKLVLADPVLAQIVSTPSVALPYIGEIENSNKLLGVGGVDGIKTGTLPEAGACLLFSSDVTVGDEQITLVGVALGGVDHDVQNVQITALLESAASNFKQTTLVTEGEEFGSYSTSWGQHAAAVASADVAVTTWGAQEVVTSVSMDSLTLAADGAQIGEVEITVAGEEFRVPLELEGELTDPGGFWRLTNPALLLG